MREFNRNQRREEQELFVTCAPNLEPILQEELEELGFTDLNPSYCGIYVHDRSMEAIYRINYCSRIASRVLLPISRFRCRDSQALYKGISEINWPSFLSPSQTFAIDANGQNYHLRNTLYTAQVTKDAICDQLLKRKGSRPSIKTIDPDVQLNLFIQDEWATISIDTSGAPLHKRGYRQENVEAPIKESLAAALLRTSNYSSEELLYDPCCGSGTFLIEAALIATQTAPGYLRARWGFMSLPDFSQEHWLQIKNEVDALRIPLAKNRITGTDINKNAVRICKAGLRAAGFHDTIDVTACDFREYTPATSPTFLITNPPHGNRIGELDYLRPLYKALGEFMKNQLLKPAKGFIFVGDAELAKEIGLATTRRYPFNNGGVDSRLMAYDLY